MSVCIPIFPKISLKKSKDHDCNTVFNMILVIVMFCFVSHLIFTSEKLFD